MITTAWAWLLLRCPSSCSREPQPLRRMELQLPQQWRLTLHANLCHAHQLLLPLPLPWLPSPLLSLLPLLAPSLQRPP